VTKIKDHIFQREGFPVYLDLVDLGQHRVAESVLETESNTVRLVLETPERVELL